MRRLNKIVFATHRILGTLLSAVFLMWFLTGLVMLYHGHFPRADKSKKMELISGTAGELPPVDSLAKGIAFSDMSVERYLGTTTFRISSPDTLVEVDEKGEAVKVMVDAARLEKVRKAWCKADVAQVDTLRKLDQWVPFGRNEKELPIIKYTFADEDEHELYVGSKSGDALQFTSHEQRVWAWLGPIPHWVYFTWLRSDQELWTTTVIWISGIGCLMAISGLWIGIVVWSRTRKNKKVRFSPYKKKWYHWHYVTGLVFGVFCLTYVFSGMMSLADVPAFVSESKLDFKPQLELMSAKADTFKLDYRKVLAAEPQATNLEWKHIGHVPFYAVKKKDGKSAYYDARDTSLVALQLSENEVLDLVKEVYKSHNVDVSGATAETQDYQELYYRVHSRGEAILPVVKVTMNDEDNGVFYINPKNGNVRYVDTTGRWAYWMYPAFHKLRLPGIVDVEWLRLLLSWIVLLGGAAVSLTGVVLGCRYIKRLVKNKE